MTTGSTAKAQIRAGMTLWHKVQRGWPIVTVGPPINSDARRTNAIATAPSPSGTPESIIVDIESIKQGSFGGHSAALLRFQVSINPLVRSDVICFEIRLYPTTRSTSDSFGPHFGAYGPAHLANSVSRPDSMATTSISGVDMFETKRGLLLLLRNSPDKNRVMSRVFRFAVVVVYLDTFILTVTPSMSEKRRARVFQRTRLYPLILDPTLQSRDELVTCARQGDDACHATCNDFGSEHLTTVRWKELLNAFSLSSFDPNPAVNTWVHRMTPA